MGALLPVLLSVLASTGAALVIEGELPDEQLVIIGTAGLRWTDLDPVTTPAMWRLASEHAVGSLVTRSVRTTSCPADGWLALGTGNRAADAPHLDGCRELQEPADDGVVPGWDDFVAARDDAAYGSRLGLLDEVLASHDRTSLAIGPGAAIALASPDGVVRPYASVPSEPAALGHLVGGVLLDTELVIVDAGSVPGSTRTAGGAGSSSADGGADERESLTTLDARVGAIVEATDSSVPLVLVSLADAGAQAHLQVLVARGLPGVGPDAQDQVLRTGATRQDGFVLASDLLPTVLAALEAPAPAGTLIGSPATGVPSRAVGADRVAAMINLDRHATGIRDHGPALLVGLIAVNLGLASALGVVALRRRERTGSVAATSGTGVPSSTPSGTLTRWRVAGVVVGALPVATFLANLAPWWRAAAAGLWLATVTATVLVAALAFLGPWRSRPLGPPTVVAAVTALVVIVDVASGSRLLLGAPLGVHPLVAGRFYGMNNSAFALLLASSLLLAAIGAAWLLARGRRALAVVLVIGVGAVVTVVDGAPTLGADFGGPPALVPAFAVLALLVGGVRVGWRRLVLVVGAGAVVVAGFALADWLRPDDSRTHLGRFVQSVLDGGLADVVGRKLGQNLEILSIAWPVILVLAVIVLLVWRRWSARADADRIADRKLVRAFAAAHPTVRHLVPAGLTGLVIALVLNDSGVAIPAIALALAGPLVVAAFAGWLAGPGEEEP